MRRNSSTDHQPPTTSHRPPATDHQPPATDHQPPTTMLIDLLHRVWEKNWPELRAGLTGGLPRFIFERNPEGLNRSVPVFYYHSVGGDLFEKDLLFLQKNGLQTATADELLSHLRKESELPPGSVVLTFDDGALNLYRVVYPLLKQYQCRAVAFICPQFHRERAEEFGFFRNNGTRPLLWPEIQEMHDSGLIDFQSHTFEHRHLGRWPRGLELQGIDARMVDTLRGLPSTVESDFLQARKVLEEKLQKRVRHLAFPQFHGNERAIQIGQQCGYEAFWWGPLPRRSSNRPGQSPLYVPRHHDRYLRRLPGRGRVSLRSMILSQSVSTIRRTGHRLKRMLSAGETQ